MKYFIFFNLLLPFPAFSQTHVSGIVSGIWNSAGSPYILDSTTVILQNTSLLINPGVTVRIGAQDSIKVYGTFKAIGSADDSVFFLPTEGDTSWKLIYFYPTSNDSNSFSYCHFEEAGAYLIKGTDCSQVYSNCTFKSHDFSLVFDNNDGSISSSVFITDAWAIVSSWGSNMLIDGNDFSQSGQGIDGYGASGTITNNVMNNENTFLSMTAMSGMTISNNIIEGSINCELNNSVINNNYCKTLGLGGVNLSIYNNQTEGELFCGGSNVAAYNNSINILGIGSGLESANSNNIQVYNNQIYGSVQTDDCTDYTCRNNVFFDASFSMGDCEIIGNTLIDGEINFGGGCIAQLDSNYLGGRLYVEDGSSVEARSNQVIWLSGNYIGEMVRIQGSLIFENNTIVCESHHTFVTDLIDVESSGDLILRNNIIIGDNVNSVGLKVESGGIVDHSYNCFWKCDTVYVGCSAGTGEFYGNPYLIEGNPFNAGLQAISPCIDAGYPWGVGDPDGTVKDMGFQFFDTRIDHPPTVYSDTTSLASLGQEYGYWAKASDDGNNLSFSFEGLPGWLNPSGILTVADSVLLGGNVPAGEPDFDFLIRAEDSAGQIDTQRVLVETVPNTVLSGIMTGILLVEDSPYLMVGDVIVPEGDCLTIEPGVEIYARRHYEPDGLFSIKVYGQILAEGTVEDTIVLASAEENPSDGDWGGILLVNCREDTSRLSFCKIYNSQYGGMKADSSINLIINNNAFEYNYYSIIISNFSQATIQANRFYNNSHYSIEIKKSIADISENIIYDSTGFSHILFWDYSSGVIHNNLINRSLSIDTYSNPLVCGNIIQNAGISISNHSEPLLINNVIYNASYYGINLTNSTPHIYNNIITECAAEGIDLDWYSGFQPDTFDIKYNNIWTNTGGNFVDFPAYLGNLATINANGDSCDIFFNISENPLFEDGEPFSFILQDSSPCIDAGNPDTSYYDTEDPANPGFALYPAKGTIINDMGRYGGHGTSFWTEVDHGDNIFTPKSITLRQNYPNPFNSATRIEFYLPRRAYVELTIYNILGKEVISLWDGKLEAGEFSFVWDASNAASGVYFASLKTKNFQAVKKMLLVK